MITTQRYTSADLEAFPDDGKRYEIIEGELHVSKAPNFFHQDICFRIAAALNRWSERTGGGRCTFAPGVIFSDDNDVVPDVVWISSARFSKALGPSGHLHAAPELIVEVLSPGKANEKRDREAKLGLYSRRGVDEYWIVDWRRRRIDIFRRSGPALVHSATLMDSGVLESPLLPGFSQPVEPLFAGLEQA
jgi:Uma2 family endonuclease